MADYESRSSASEHAGHPHPVPEVVKANHDALQYLEELVPEGDFRYIMFEDNLVTVSDTGKEIGHFVVTVEPSRYKGLECFLIHVISHASVGGAPCGTTLVCYVSKCLETLEQQHHEYVKLDYSPMDRKTVLLRQNDSYTITKTVAQGEEKQRTTKSFPLDQFRGFISEGSNFLLHRLLIEKPMDKELQFISFDSEFHLCPVTYKRLDEHTQTVDNVDLLVLGIERSITSAFDLPLTWLSYFMNDGHLTHRLQVGSPMTMKITRVPVRIEREEEALKPVFEKKLINWEEDLELHSKFLNRKEELKADHATFMRHHPELHALLADFLQFLLLRKPEDVIKFAADYFFAFSNAMPDCPPYLASTAPTPFPASHTNQRIDELRAPTR